jgi:acetylornithine deacetylase/succinyl-diaminopimelate desuccinylase-like protein
MGQATQATSPAAAAPDVVDPMFASIREEGMQRSQVMQTLNYLTNAIGPRMTGSPNLKKANEWTRDQLTKFGLENAHLEPWAFNGRGWVVKRFAMQVIEPQQMALIAYPKAWSEGLEKPMVGEVVLMEARTEEDLQKYRGKLKGAIVLNGGARNIGPKFTADAQRLTDADLQRLASGRSGTNPNALGGRGGRGAATTPATAPSATAPATPATASAPATAAATAPGGAGAPGGGRGRGGGAGPALARGRIIAFLMEEGAAMELTMTTGNEMGIVVGQAQTTLPTVSGGAARGGANAYAANAVKSLPQVTVSVEHYNRLVRIAQLGVPMKIDVDLQVQYFSDDPNAYNTIAEIPGSDLKDEVVMLGAHLDSWHMGTGATDNGTGVAECMEAVRIIKALNIQPRRTIRIGLWTGEELGLRGSSSYVGQHLGRNTGDLLGGRGRGGRGAASAPATAAAPAGTVAATGPSVATQAAARPGMLPAHAKFSVYFNTDEGGGRFRGVYAGNNPGAVEQMRKWLAPVRDLGITVVSPSSSSGSDHESFANIGLPAMNFIPDPIDYWAGTWHTSQDLYDHVVPDDIKASSVILATCIYQAAMADEKMPRRPQ